MSDPEFEEYILELESLLKGKEYTRLPKSNLDIEDLYIIAETLFEKKDKSRVNNSGADILGQVVNDIATIISRTYAEKGDYSRLADDQALTLIRDVLLRHNPAIINRNAKRRLPTF